MNTRKRVMRIFPQDIPEKIYYSISEVSEYTQVEAHVLRYWESKFSKLSPKRMGGNQRKYTRSDLDLIFVIIHLLYNEGYTLEGAERKIKDQEQYDKLRRQYGVGGTGPDEEATATAATAPAGGPSRRELRELKNTVKKTLKLLKK